jgi:hypothetical protein
VFDDSRTSRDLVQSRHDVWGYGGFLALTQDMAGTVQVSGRSVCWSRRFVAARSACTDV